MSSTFYHDVLAAVQDTALVDQMQMVQTNQEDHGSEITIELHIDRVDGLKPGKRLLFFKTIYGESSTKTTMPLQEENETGVEFNQVLPLPIGLQSVGDGMYTSLVQYVVLDLLVYSKDKSKNEEFLGRVMLPVLCLTTQKQSFTLPAGQKPNHLTQCTPPLLSLSAKLVTPPEDYVGLTGQGDLPVQCRDSTYQYKVALNDTVLDFPGEFEKVEIYIPNVDTVLCDVKFKADVYLTNFRLIILSRDTEHADCSNWLMFPAIASIEKSPYQSLSHRDQKRCYTIKCYDSRLIKLYVPAISRTYRNIKRLEIKFSSKNPDGLVDGQLLYEMKYNPGSGSNSAGADRKPAYRHKSISSYLDTAPAEICDSDGEAKDGLSENEILGDELYSDNEPITPAALYNTSPNTEESVPVPRVKLQSVSRDYSEDEFSEDDFLEPVKRHDSDAGSIDSLDYALDSSQARVRSSTGNSVSSFTSYIRTASKSKGKKRRPIARKWQHSSKIMMDNLRLRIIFLRVNPVYQPCRLLKHSLTDAELNSFAKFREYNIDVEYSRQGDLKEWTKLDNHNFNRCKSYPSHFLIPTRASKEAVLQSILDFRSKCRIPALCWLNNSGAILLRSAQPRTGILQKHCTEDEGYLSVVLKMSAQQRPPSETSDLPFIIFDARSKIAASGNKMKGKGTENTQYYKNTKLCYLDMANIHAIRDSYDKLIGLAAGECSVHWLKKLDQTQWYVHVQGLVRGAHFISQHLAGNGAALVHCSDGWDRTSQLTSLSLLLIDPFYRTFAGFQVLIEREWLSFGHRFHDRLGLAHPNQRSPIFVLFLDAVHQIMCQFPNFFQFSTGYLLVLSELHGSAWTVSFLQNCQQEREGLVGLEIWTVLHAMRTSLTNHSYTERIRPIVPKTSLRHIRLWREHFLRYDLWTEPLSEDVVHPVVWVPDDAVVKCQGCDEGFSAIKRKHHCRLCGNIFCGACANRKICLPEIGYNHPVLVCQTCHTEHTAN